MFALTKEDSGLYTKIDCEEEKKLIYQFTLKAVLEWEFLNLLLIYKLIEVIFKVKIW